MNCEKKPRKLNMKWNPAADMGRGCFRARRVFGLFLTSGCTDRKAVCVGCSKAAVPVPPWESSWVFSGFQIKQ